MPEPSDANPYARPSPWPRPPQRVMRIGALPRAAKPAAPATTPPLDEPTTASARAPAPAQTSVLTGSALPLGPVRPAPRAAPEPAPVAPEAASAPEPAAAVPEPETATAPPQVTTLDPLVVSPFVPRPRRKPSLKLRLRRMAPAALAVLVAAGGVVAFNLLGRKVAPTVATPAAAIATAPTPAAATSLRPSLPAPATGAAPTASEPPQPIPARVSSKRSVRHRMAAPHARAHRAPAIREAASAAPAIPRITPNPEPLAAPPITPPPAAPPPPSDPDAPIAAHRPR